MLILRTPKGWTGPKIVDGVQVEGTWRAHQVPLEEVRTNPEHLKLLEEWLRSYQAGGAIRRKRLPARVHRRRRARGLERMSVNPHTNGGQLLQPLDMPDFRDFAVKVDTPGATEDSATAILGNMLEDVMQPQSRHAQLPHVCARRERLQPPAGRLQGQRQTLGRAVPAGRRKPLRRWPRHGSALRNLCEGWLEGYLLTGRHGFFSCYEAFIHIIDSMFNQHAKWLKACHKLPWRKPIASLNYLLTSHVWRQDHNGFSHQDPGFIDHVANKKADTVRIYLPPDANTLLSVADHCLRSRNYINLIIAGKQPQPQWLNIDAAVAALHRRRRRPGPGPRIRRRSGSRHGLRRRRPHA